MAPETIQINPKFLEDPFCLVTFKAKLIRLLAPY